MRHLVLVPLMVAMASIPLLAQDSPKPPSARISGRVVAADTGKPIRWATVHAVSDRGRQQYTTTDAEGRFEFEELVPGTYRLDAAAERYLRMYHGGQPYTGLGAVVPKGITVREAESFDKADLSLPRGGAIEGRLLDEFGDPAPGLMVQLSQVVYAGGRQRLMPMGSRERSLLSDDRGHFRIHGLAPGTYYLSVLAGVFAEQSEAGGFAPTYYPGTTNLSSALPLTIEVGQEITNLTFPLTPARMARISGRAVDEEGDPIASATLLLATADRSGISDFFVTRAQGNLDGTFVLRNVPPGLFTLQGFGRPPAEGPGNLAAAPFGSLPLIVAGVDQADLVLRITTGPSLRGRIVSEDPAVPLADPTSVRVSSFAVKFNTAPVGGGPSPYEVKEDGTFELKNLFGYRVVRVSVRDPDWMLRRVTHQGRDITDEAIDFTAKSDVTDVEVVVTNRVTAIEGTVTDERGEPVTNYSVIVFATDASKWGDRSRFVATARPSQDGTFVVRGLPPDEYYAVALPVAVGTEWQDPNYLKTLQDRAMRFFLGDGEQKKLSVRMQQ